MFNTNATFSVKLLSGTEKKVLLSFPTDAQLLSRAKRLISVSRANGSEELKNFGAVEQEFLASLIATDSPVTELSEGESIYAIDRVLRCRVIDAERQGDRFRITMQVANGEVVHTLGIPTLDAARKYGKSLYKSEPKRNSVESHQVLDGVAPFWESLGGVAEGYAEGSGVPVLHKEAAISEVIAQMHLAMEEPDPEA